MKSTSSDADVHKYVTVRRELKKEIRSSKRSYEEGIAERSKENPKEFFNYIRSKKSVKETIGPLQDCDGELIHDKTTMANILNDTFSAVFTKEDIENIPTPDNMFQGTDENRLTDIKISAEDVETVLNKLRVNKSPRPDGIHPRGLKELKDALILPLKIIFNKSLCEGKVPDDWKKANVTPILKIGNKKDLRNYRPISLTSVICKLLESLIRDKIVNHLEDNSLILNSQHGFRKHRSCLTNLIEFFEGVTNIYDVGKPVDIVYLDFQKAFDKVPHERLMAKLQAHGIEGKLMSWIRDWLNNRIQRVTLDGMSSQWNSVISGVPQGSVLGPLLFILYINDLDIGIKSKISKFADDTKIAGRVGTIEEQEQIQMDLDRLTEWAEKWQMSFNVDKCAVMHVGKANMSADYSMSGSPLKKCTDMKDLGVTMTNNLKPSKHCLEAVKIANLWLGLIARNIEFKSKKVIIMLYNSFVRPHLEYAVQFWSPQLAKDIALLERVQRRVTKLI
jgi:hypothetical protein